MHAPPRRKPTAALLLALLLSACATAPQGLRFDTRYSSANQDSRVQFLILHFTAGSFQSSLRTLTEGGPNSAEVSSHYLVRDQPVEIYRLVDESRRAWHAGTSFWQGNTNLNAASIGIEIVNPGLIQAPGGPRYAPYPQAQIDAVIALCKDIVARHHIRPERVLGHSDIQPLNKTDPGPRFPWRQLAEAGLILWPDEAQVSEKQINYQGEGQLPDVNWFQDQLIRFGYGLARSGQWDMATTSTLAAFQMKYRPARYDGQPDAETAALLEVVNLPGGMRRLAPLPVFSVPRT